jgi:Tfp pilus assembly protein PilV
MSPAQKLFKRLRHDEAGFGVLEVLASAVLVAMLAVGVLKTFDAASFASGNTKSRSVAADLAQQDQERMRAFRAKELSNLNSTYTRTVAGVNFTITSTAVWVNDGSGTRRCGLTSGRADYLRITSSVVWDRMSGAAPVTSNSLYAPPSGSFGDEGNLGFEVLDRSAVGVPGVTVTLSGTANRTGTTDAQGCIYFSFLPQGNYTAVITKAGFVDYQGNSTITKAYGVNGGTTQVQPIDYDQAGSIVADVRSKKATLSTTSTTPTSPVTANALAGYITVGHSQLASPNTRIFGTGALLGPAITNGGLFPFTSTYNVYTGNCTGTGGNSAAAVAAPAVTPGGTSTVTVNEPGLAIYAAAAGTTASTPYVKPPQGTVVKLTADPPCAATTTTHLLDNAGFIGPASPSMPSSTDPGVPSGTYDICMSYDSPSETGTTVRKRIKNNVAITNLTTPTHVIVPHSTSDPAGTC